ncbi:succinylglutamate desuccinylase/aspartoacylase family protein [Sinobacterium caligoides]|uniref:Succinylglutamate desuccinylase/aspartoacylase family protein n=1 Tax=Sinobacterium caligoides TaxID=933926 RepID=A0A3N2DYQ0_9GAMM|nr:M14 family metallocarboxypeptidase [Sinobacterium caligoides]ROS04980.1 succinylglutamate desuccinylase/aspartoacylase family protein [Sinobacterium caligoides]
MNDIKTYPVGVPGQKWGATERQAWLTQQTVKRSYRAEVVEKIEQLREEFDVEQYGLLSYSDEDYPLFALKSRQWQSDRETVLVTGGVHGYETSGVQGALRFLATKAQSYSQHFNIVVAPCLSPWGYETINRWTPNAIDPNRSFYEGSPAAESAALMDFVASLKSKITAHIDLHETTDTDDTEFRPAVDARDGKVGVTYGGIPDGFYLVDNSAQPTPEFQKAIIDSVSKVTHIAPADEAGMILDVPISQAGVIEYAVKSLGLCTGLADAPYTTTTEVYPDSPRVDDENCIVAQVAAITGGLDYLISQLAK